MASDYGLDWVQEGLSINPCWTVEPCVLAIETLVRSSLAVPLTSPCVITFLAEGTFNKVYKVGVSNCIYVMRVALPIETPLEIKSEIATMLHLRQHVSAASRPY
jgi:hypothetical protein